VRNLPIGFTYLQENAPTTIMCLHNNEAFHQHLMASTSTFTAFWQWNHRLKYELYCTAFSHVNFEMFKPLLFTALWFYETYQM